MSIFDPIKKDLEAVNAKLHKEYFIKAGHLSSFAHMDFTPLNTVIRPGVVILSGRLFGHINAQVIALAVVVQFIYMASSIHFKINEDNHHGKPPVDPKDGSQFPVLVGDYLYSKFFNSLCDAHIVKYLKPLSQVICSIHEGGILRQKTQQQDLNKPSIQRKIAYRETAALFETGCRLVANLVGAATKEQDTIAKFGRELGIAYGLMENKAGFQYIDPHLQEAYYFLNKLPQNKYRSILQELLNRLQQNKLDFA